MSLIQQFNSLFDFVDRIPKEALFYGIIAFMTVMFLWENFLSLRQFLVEKRTKQVPTELVSVLEDTTFQKSRLYALDKRVYNFIHDFYSQTESYLILFLGALPFLWRLSVRQLDSLGIEFLKSEIAYSCLFVTYATIFGNITSLPWTIYFTFVLEEKHGFNKQTFGFFVKDNIKKFVLSLVLTIPILSLLIFIIRIGGDYFFIYAWLFITVVSLFLITVYADYIAPLFDKYTPLPEGELRTKIEELAKSLKFPLYKLYVVEGSKRSVHSNAYMYGFYKAKRIVLFDTLIEGYKPAVKETEEAKKDDEETKKPEEVTETDKLKSEEKEERKGKGCSTDEILAVLAHELGHWKLKHNLKNLVLSEINTFLYFLIFAMLMNRQVFYSAFGFDNERPVFIGLIIILQFLFAPYNEIVSFVMTAIGRRFEFQADQFAKSLGKTGFLKSALIKLHIDNLSFPACDWLYSTWHYSHPPLIERLEALNDSVDERNKRKSS